jgi:hypothetical protein
MVTNYKENKFIFNDGKDICVSLNELLQIRQSGLEEQFVENHPEVE